MSRFDAFPSVAVIVLNWRQAQETLECLTSVRQISYPNTTVLVVDNGSGDDSVPMIHQHFPEIHVIETHANLGYAGGNNVGIRWALGQGAESICILNNDVTVSPDFLNCLVLSIKGRSEIGVVTPLVAEKVDKERIWALGSDVNRRTGEVSRLHAGEPVDHWRKVSPFRVDVAPGAAMLVKREVFEHVGLLDEAFFLYYEETDWCLRVQRAGYRIQAAPASVVWHTVSATLGATSPVIDYYMLRNHLRLISRHWSGVHRCALWGWIVMRNLLTIAAFTVKTHDGDRIPNRNARLFALRDAMLGRGGKMGPDVARVCNPGSR